MSGSSVTDLLALDVCPAEQFWTMAPAERAAFQNGRESMLPEIERLEVEIKRLRDLLAEKAVT
jgi:hypothetical protein